VQRPTYPNTWLRLERMGSKFWGYASTDGQSWTLLRGSPYDFNALNGNETTPRVDGNMANTLALGMAVTAHNDGDLTGGIGVFSGFAKWTPKPIGITTQPPATVSVPANSRLEFGVVATGDPLHYQWSKDGTDIPGATGATFAVALAAPADAGTYRVRCYGAGQTAVTSSPTVVTITTDTTKPTLVEAVGASDLVRVRVSFSEPVTAPSATTAGNYTLAPSLAVSAAALSADGYSVTLTTPRQTEDTVYTITVNNVQDRGGNAIAANSTVQFHSAKFISGRVAWERWNGGGSIANLITSVADGSIGPSDIQWYTTLFESGRDLADQYRGRGWGWFKAPASGNYVFMMTVDDNARLFLSTDDNPANKKAIAAEATWSNNRDWGAMTEEQRSDTYWATEWPTWNTITLVKDKVYYMEALWQEGGGGDGVEVTYVMEGAAVPANGTASALSGNVIGVYASPTILPPTIIAPTANSAITLNPGESTTLTVQAEGPGGTALTYQWQLNGRDIPGATSADYVIANAHVTHTGQYWAIVRNKNGSARTPPINVLVTATGVFAIDAEDMDYEGGKTKPEASVMPYMGGAYDGLNALVGIDYNSGNGMEGGWTPVYRTGDPVTAPTTSPMSSDNGQFARTRMGEWTVTANYKIGWVDTGDWGNYTRTFPTPAKTYYVFAAQSRDGFGDNMLRSSLGIVTAGVGTTTQTVDLLGQFRSPGTGGWSRNNLVALTDDTGKIKTVEIGGTKTIRWNYDSGDSDYLAFVPAVVAVGKAKVTVSGNNVTISEDPPSNAIVQSATSVLGPWTDVGPAPQTQAIGPGVKLFRLKR